MKNKKQNPVVPIMFEEKMKKQLEKLAKKEGRTFAGQVRYLLAKSLACIVLLVVLSAMMLVGCSGPTAQKTNQQNGPKTIILEGSYQPINFSTVVPVYFYNDTMTSCGPRDSCYNPPICSLYDAEKDTFVLAVGTRIFAECNGFVLGFHLDLLVVTKDTLWQPK